MDAISEVASIADATMTMQYSKNSGSPSLSGLKGTIFVVILLTILTIIAYHDVTDNFFSSDDFVWLKNAIITLKNPLNIFTTDIVGWFRPFGHLTFAINYLIFGVKYPVGYVVVSITFHIITAFFVFILTAMLLRNKGTALWAAAFFAIQHTHWEAVAWSSIVAEVLAALWFIVTIICFLKWRERSYPQHVQPRRNSGKWYYILAHVAMVCSFLSAELSVTLPAMLILTDMIYHWRLWKNFSIRAAFSHVWFFLLWAIYVVYELFLQWNGLHLGKSGDYHVNIQFFLILLRSLLAYIFPKPLLIAMLRNQDILLLIFWIWISIVVIGVFTLLLFKIHVSSYKDVLYNCLWVVITMLPFCGFTRFTIIDSRQFYLSSVGVSILFSLALTSLYRSIRRKISWSGILQKGILAVCVLGIFAWNIFEIWHEEARFEDFASEGAQVLTDLRKWYPEFSSDARLYFSGLYTPHQFFADMIQVYYALESSQTSYVGAKKIKRLQQQKEFKQPTYLFSRHRGELHDLTPERYKFSLPKDGKIDIGREAAQKYLFQGFSHPEIWIDGQTTFVWSRKPTSRIKVRLPAQNNAITMILRIFPFHYPGLPQQSVDILIDDHSIETLQLSNDVAAYKVIIPRELVSPNVTIIQFRYAYTASPSEISNGKIQDGRKLAVAFDYVIFKMN